VLTEPEPSQAGSLLKLALAG